MADNYQRGSDQDWLQHSNDELARMLRKRDARIRLLHFINLVLLLLLGWVVLQYSKKGAVEELWKF